MHRAQRSAPILTELVAAAELFKFCAIKSAIASQHVVRQVGLVRENGLEAGRVVS